MSLNYLSSIPHNMKLLQLRKNVKKTNALLSTTERQWEYFDWQRNALKELTLYAWYGYLIDYLEMQADSAMSKLADTSTPKESIAYWQARQNLSIEFLNFLDMMTH